MKIKIYAEESYTTTITREAMEIDTDNYPELAGMTEDEVSEYIDNNAWDMKSTDELYSSLGEECVDKSLSYDSISGYEETIFVEEVK
jgi:hypothetical protein